MKEVADQRIAHLGGEKKDRRYYKLGVRAKDPNEVRSAEVPIIEK